MYICIYIYIHDLFMICLFVMYLFVYVLGVYTCNV